MWFFQSHRARTIRNNQELIPDEWFTDQDGNRYYLYTELDTIIVEETDGTLYDLHFEKACDTMANWMVLHDQEDENE